MLPSMLVYLESRTVYLLVSYVSCLNFSGRDMNADKGPAGVSNFAGSVDPHGERASPCIEHTRTSQ